MANKRMFSKNITETDIFLDMPLESQALYFHLNMNADDDGFVSSPKKIMRVTGSSADSYKILLVKQFIFEFENGVCVIKDWKIHNYIAKDRYIETLYSVEKQQLIEDDNKMYTRCIHNAGADKNRIDKNRIDNIVQVFPRNDLVVGVIDYFNNKLGKKLTCNNKKYQSLINARSQDGFILEDFKTVIDIKYNEWISDSTKIMYLRPETLFGNKFETYLNQTTETKSRLDVIMER